MNKAIKKQAAPFNLYSRYLKEKYGAAVYRVAVDAGFSCPNRDAGRTAGGCAYCDEYGSRAPYLGDISGLEEQIRGSMEFLRRRYAAHYFILYFQAFSNTHAPVEVLRRVYDAGLGTASFKELIVSTRPDCIDEQKAALLASYRHEGRDVWVELGLQSAQDSTLRRVYRGHSVEDFSKAYALLKKHNLNVAVHLIFGLPGEHDEHIMDTVGFIAGLRPDGVKIHNLHIPLHTALYAQYLLGEITAPSARTHLEYVIRALSLLPPSTLIMRLTCDTPAARLAAPARFWPKQRFYELVKQEMLRRGICQGSAYEPRKMRLMP
jgi:radical SAM protein (TIGR01212 family)